MASQRDHRRGPAPTDDCSRQGLRRFAPVWICRTTTDVQCLVGGVGSTLREVMHHPAAPTGALPHKSGGLELFDGGVAEEESFDALRAEVDRGDGLLALALDGDDGAESEAVVCDAVAG